MVLIGLSSQLDGDRPLNGCVTVGRFLGAHLNAAVSLALALDGSFDWSLVPGYTVSNVDPDVGATIVWLILLCHIGKRQKKLARN